MIGMCRNCILNYSNKIACGGNGDTTIAHREVYLAVYQYVLFLIYL